jgi:hypothetical protein
LSKDSTQYHERSDFFKVKQFVVAGDSLSFDDVEHGIIRSSVVKWGLGYVPKIFPGKFERTLRTDEVDPRIHFLLNCGAQSCPPVYTFSAKNFDAEADRVAKDYLASVSEYNAQANLLKTSPLIKWFRGDFGGKEDDLLPIFYKYDIVLAGKNPKIEYGDYDWGLRLGNFY